VVREVELSRASTQRRRSERISESLPIIVRGTDLLGQPFEERACTLALNLYGCRYASRYHLPKNTWVTLEIVRGSDRHNLRARVAWIQRPRSVRELFQIAVELESPGNYWGVDASPPDWEAAAASVPPPADLEAAPEPRLRAVESETDFASSLQTAKGHLSDMTQGPPESDFESQSAPGHDDTSAPESPLLREWRGEIERQASLAVESAAAKANEQIRGMIEELERARATTGSALSAELAAKQESLIEGLQSELDRSLRGVRELFQDLGRQADGLRAESDAALESIGRVAQARLDAEAAQLQQKPPEPSHDESAALDSELANWRSRLASEMALAQTQWSELLQSSLDSGVERLVKELSGRSHEILRGAEQRMSERLGELRQPLAQISSTAQETLTSVQAALDQDVARARASLAEIDHSANRTKEFSEQLEAASHETLNELHGRLENILEAQTEEMKRRAESILADVPQRVGPSLDSLGRQLAERTIAEIDSKIAPRMERVSESLRELDAREAQTEETLRLHRERLRQVSDTNQREVAAQMSATLANLRGDFEAARKESLSKWNEELDAAGVRAAHAAAESIGRSSEWFQQEARSRLQVLVEQALTSAASGFEERTGDASRKFDAHLEDQSNARLAQIQQQFDGLAGEVAGRTRSQLDEAAGAAAASFGQVIREASERGTAQIAEASRSELADRSRDLENLSQQLRQKFEADAGASAEHFHGRMASELDASVARGRDTLAAEFAKSAENFRAERETLEAGWTETTGRLSDEATTKFQDRLQTACDSWTVSSVRRLNERGQNAVDGLLHSADQALRESFARVFEGLSETLRGRPASGSGANAAGFAPPAGAEPPPIPPPSEGASSSANA
jgi:hypothetical protein